MRQSPQTMSLKSLRERGERDKHVKVKRVAKNVQAVHQHLVRDIPSFSQLANVMKAQARAVRGDSPSPTLPKLGWIQSMNGNLSSSAYFRIALMACTCPLNRCIFAKAHLSFAS